MATLVTIVALAIGLALSEPAGHAREQASPPAMQTSPTGRPVPKMRVHHDTTPIQRKRTLEPVPAAPPTKLEIPSLGIDAGVGSVVMQGGSLTPPEATWADLARAYWWSEVQAPGNPTSATTFIVGHTCHATDCPAVFNQLQTIQPGAIIIVITPKGTLTYRVVLTETIPFEQQTSHPEMFADRPDTLVLVTCRLRSDHSRQTHNFAVRAELVKATK